MTTHGPDTPAPPPPDPAPRSHSDTSFVVALALIGGVYVALVVAMVFAEAAYTPPGAVLEVLRSPHVRYAIKLSLLTCGITAILCLWVATPLAYLMSRFSFRGKALIDAVIDIPIVLPPLVVGLCLLILFQAPPLKALQRHLPITYAVPSIIIAQFAVSCAFAARTLRVTFDQINPRSEQVALTLGCTRGQAFWRVALPEARRGLLAAGTLAWARALGEFGPILVFSGATRMRTEVLSTSVYLYLSVGELHAALAVSLLMVGTSLVVVMLMRLWGGDPGWARAVAPHGASGGRS